MDCIDYGLVCVKEDHYELWPSETVEAAKTEPHRVAAAVAGTALATSLYSSKGAAEDLLRHLEQVPNRQTQQLERKVKLALLFEEKIKDQAWARDASKKLEDEGLAQFNTWNQGSGQLESQGDAQTLLDVLERRMDHHPAMVSYVQSLAKEAQKLWVGSQTAKTTDLGALARMQREASAGGKGIYILGKNSSSPSPAVYKARFELSKHLQRDGALLALATAALALRYSKLWLLPAVGGVALSVWAHRTRAEHAELATVAKFLAMLSHSTKEWNLGHQQLGDAFRRWANEDVDPEVKQLAAHLWAQPPAVALTLK